MKVAFFVYPSAFQAPGGGERQLLKTKEYLEKTGVSVKLFDQWQDNLKSFDILHVFGSVKECLNLMISAQAKGVKTALSTICWYSWKSAWHTYPSLSGRGLSLAQHAAKVFWPSLPSMRRSMMKHSDILFPNSETEAHQLNRFFGVSREKIIVVPNGVDRAFEQADPHLFIEKFGFRDFVLCVGRIEPRKNQLNMVRALNGIKTPVVFIGEAVPHYKDYYEACQKEADSNIHFLGALPQDSGLLTSAYAAANTFVLASWLETPGLAALEAGLAGTKVVITEEGATREYFGDYAAFVAPDSLRDIRKKVLETLEKPKDEKLKNHIRTHYLWEHAARKTQEGYRRLLSSQNNSGKYESKGELFNFQKNRRRVGIEIQATRGPRSGLGVYAQCLSEALSAKKDIDLNLTFLDTAQVKAWRTPHRIFWENFILPRMAKNKGCDLLHVTAFAAPLLKPSKIVMTVHDLIGMAFPNQVGSSSRWYWGKYLPASIRQADRIIAISEHTKKDLINLLKIPESRIRVIYSACRRDFPFQTKAEAIAGVNQKFLIKRRYLLSVGTWEPRKNFLRVIEAFGKLKKQYPDFQLIIVGSTEFARSRFFENLKKEKNFLDDDIIVTGYVSNEDLNSLYRGAEAFLFPSLYEGFGFPVLEAMSCDVPVITSNVSSLPETAGEAALYVDPYNPDDIFEAVKTILGDNGLRKELIAKGRKQVEKFSWQKTVSETIQVYEELV